MNFLACCALALRSVRGPVQSGRATAPLLLCLSAIGEPKARDSSPLPRPPRPLSARIQSSSRRRFSTSTQKISAPPVGSFSIENPTITEFPGKSNRNQPVELQSRRARVQLLLCIGVTFWDSARPRSRGVAFALPPVAHNYGLPGCYLSALPRPSRPLSRC